MSTFTTIVIALIWGFWIGTIVAFSTVYMRRDGLSLKDAVTVALGLRRAPRVRDVGSVPMLPRGMYRVYFGLRLGDSSCAFTQDVVGPLSKAVACLADEHRGGFTCTAVTIRIGLQAYDAYEFSCNGRTAYLAEQALPISADSVKSPVFTHSGFPLGTPGRH